MEEETHFRNGTTIEADSSLSLPPIHIYTYFIRLSGRAPPQPSPYNRSSTLLLSSILYPSFGGKASIIQAVGNCDRRILLESDTLACLLNKWWNNIFKTPIIRGRVSPSPYGGPVFIGPWSINAAKKEERSFIGVEGGRGGRATFARSIFTLQSNRTPPQCRIIAAIYTGPPNVLIITTSNARAWITPLLCTRHSWFPGIRPFWGSFFFPGFKFGRIYWVGHYFAFSRIYAFASIKLRCA